MTILHNTQWIRKQKAVSGSIGLEIETETMERYPLEPFGKMGEYNFPAPHQLEAWKVVEDHSLRNVGFEYILGKPLDFVPVGEALQEFDKKSKEVGAQFLQDRHSTSVHVHLNYQNETFRALANFCTMFLLFEEVLVRFCGEDRKSNFFCITSRYAEGVTKRFTSFFSKVYNADKTCLTTLDEQISKYSSLNIVPLYKLGSIEIRTMRGVTDVATIYNWVGMLNALYEFARQDMTPHDVINFWRDEGVDFFRRVFGKYAKLLEDDFTIGLIEDNLWAASSVACSVPDWGKLTDEMIKAQADYDDYDELMKAKKPYDGGDEAVKPWAAPPVRQRAPRAPMPMAVNHIEPVEVNWGNPMVILDDAEDGDF